MDIEWHDTKGNLLRAPIEKSVVWLIDILGREAAVSLLIQLGGSRINAPVSHVHGTSLLVQAIGAEKALALGKATSGEHIDLPVADAFVARHLRSAGMSFGDIARAIRRPQRTIYRHINGQTRPYPYGFNGPATKISVIPAE